MNASQAITLLVLVAVVAALIWDRVRSDVVALAGAAVLLMTGVVRPVEVQGAFASPAIIALASLFVIAYAMELSGLLDAAIRGWCGCAAGSAGPACGWSSAWPARPRRSSTTRRSSCWARRSCATSAESLGLSPKRYLIPLSYAAVLGGCCTLIGTSTNLLVNDMAAVAGQPRSACSRSRRSGWRSRSRAACTCCCSAAG